MVDIPGGGHTARPDAGEMGRSLLAAARRLVAELERISALLDRVTPRHLAAAPQADGSGYRVAAGAITPMLGALAYNLESETENSDDEPMTRASRRMSWPPDRP